ncbi:MAG TPA: DUF2085 domain-containing protein [Vicinamibacterales bacterium]|nr:DUF2085 domain-containing protein [Vicinamibacterales bacterium]
MVRILAVASVVWPLMMAAAVWDRAATGGSVWSSVLYAAASRICHQRPERSFHTVGVKWPVCGRCSGLYLAAPFGAVAAVTAARRRRGGKDLGGRVTQTAKRLPRSVVLLLAIASVPTAITLAGEWSGLIPVTTLARALAAVPLGAAIAFVIVRVVSGPPRTIEYTGAE